MAELPPIQLNISSYPRRLLSFLLIYRWISLAPAIWLFISPTGPVTPNKTSILLLTLTAGFTLLITLSHHFNRPLLGKPFFLAADLLFIAILLTLSGAGSSLYFLYALSPLLTGILFFQRRGLLLTSSIFTVFYLAALLFMHYIYTLNVELSALFTQLVGLWLIPFLFEYPLTLLKQLSSAHQWLVTTHQNLTHQTDELTATHRQLEVLHELTLFLQGATDRQSVQQRLLKAVTEELSFSRAVVGLVNPALQRLEIWQARPPAKTSSAIPISLTPENGPIAEALLNRQVRWCSEKESPSADENLDLWLDQDNWLILPMIWEEQAVGVLLVAVETMGPVNMADDRWAILTSLVSQAAAALSTINRTRHLAIEKERNRIARDIHDTVAQSLFGMAFTLDACVKLLPNQVQMVRQELIELRSIADRVRQEVRQSILDIWPSGLTEEKFRADLCKYVAHTSPDHVFHVDFTIDGDFDGLPAVIRRSLYRVSQEALANAARHAGVDSARLYLGVEPEEVHLSIRDKGQGFDPKLALARERDREHFGLRGMQERIHSLKGTCDILSQMGHGTQVLVRVPILGRNGYG